jgi:anti-anti-sigma factor
VKLYRSDGIPVSLLSAEVPEYLIENCHRAREPLMKINRREIEGHLIFDLLEDITYENAKELGSFVTGNLKPGFRNVVLNIKDVLYVNSFALSVLIKTMQDIENEGYQFFLMNVNQRVKTLLKVTGVLSKFRIFRE